LSKTGYFPVSGLQVTTWEPLLLYNKIGESLMGDA